MFIATILIVVPTNYIFWNVIYEKYFGHLTLKILNALNISIGSLLMISYIRASKTKSKVFKRNYFINHKNNYSIAYCEKCLKINNDIEI